MPVDESVFRQLAEFDTPTICNALEMLDPSFRNRSYTTTEVTCLNGPRPRVGWAYTATMRSLHPSQLEGDQLKEARLEYYRYMYDDGPEQRKVAVMQDLDGQDAGRGPFWGEFNTRVHQSAGYQAVVTNGSVRDVEQLPTQILMLAGAGLRPSHANVHIVDFGNQVNVCGMVTVHHDLVHADSHGAVTFPPAMAWDVISKAAEFVAAEAPVIAAAKSGTLTLETLEALYMERKRAR